MSRPLSYGVLAFLAAGLLIAGLVAFVYQPLLVAGPDLAYPTGTQAWGHLLKTVYLSRQASSGHVYPALMSCWAAGAEPFRQTSPAAYYVLALLSSLTGSVFVAGARLIPLAALAGGLFWLLFARRLGWAGATAAGLAWTVWPEHLRVAVVEGDYPRVLAAALLPLLFWSFLGALERRWWPWSGILFVAILQLTILSEVLTALTALGAFLLMGFVLRFFSGARGRDTLRVLSLATLGLLSTAWWLLPALPGWRTALELQAQVSGAASQGVWPASNPLFFWGLSSAVLLSVTLLSIRRRTPLGQSLLVCAILGFILSTPEAAGLSAAVLPAGILEPSRLATLGPLAVFISFLALSPDPAPADTPSPSRRRLPVFALVAILLIVVVGGEAYGFLETVRTGQPSADLDELSRTLLLRRSAGRIAVLDMGELGSEPSYVLTLPGWREQVFGSFWSSAPAAPSLSLLNTALSLHDYPYVIDRSLQLGAGYLVVLGDAVDAEAFHESAEAAGFTGPESFGRLLLYSRATPLRAFLSPYTTLAVGPLAGYASFAFPAVETGPPGGVHGYDLQDLAGYHVLLLTGTPGSVPDRAGDLLLAYVRQGGRLILDCDALPWPSPEGEPDWGEDGLAGVYRIGDGEVWLTSAGLVHRALVGGAAAELALLASLLNLTPGTPPARETVALDAYETTGSGYRLVVDVPTGWAGRRMVLPIAAAPILRVRVDGHEVLARPVEGLLSLEAVPGRRRVEVSPGRSDYALIGAAATGWTVLLALAFAAVQVTRNRRRGNHHA